MLGSATLDIGIGLVLVFLLASLILTSVQEALQAFFRTRARTLECAILEVLQGDKALQTQLYNHPLIYALHRGQGTGAMPTVAQLPSYIPRETFAAALIDLMSKEGGPKNDAMDTAFEGLRRVAGTDMAALRREVEGWYDAAMDRASGTFKRRSQGSLFWLGLVVAVLLNLNAVILAQYLTVSPHPSELVATIAQDFAHQQQDAAHQNAQHAPAAAAAPHAAPAGQAAGGRDEANAASAAPAGNSTEATTRGAATAAPAAAAPDATQTVVSDRRVRDLTDQLVEAGLPIGWSAPSVRWIERGFPNREVSFSGPFSIAALFAWILLLAGYFITAFAVMLGAPFWFDILNKFMVIRGTVKPKEKSPDEASEDRGGGSGVSGAVGTKT